MKCNDNISRISSLGPRTRILLLFSLRKFDKDGRCMWQGISHLQRTERNTRHYKKRKTTLERATRDVNFVKYLSWYNVCTRPTSKTLLILGLNITVLSLSVILTSGERLCSSGFGSGQLDLLLMLTNELVEGLVLVN